MFRRFSPLAKSALLFALCLSATPVQPQSQPRADPLPSWKDGKTKQSIIAFVKKVTDKTDAAYVSPAERIAARIAVGDAVEVVDAATGALNHAARSSSQFQHHTHARRARRVEPRR